MARLMNLQKIIKQTIDSKTKPPGSLGQLETVAAQVATIQQSINPVVDSCELIIFAADHGMATQGVSAYPQEVTAQMVLNFLHGGAAANVFAKSVGATVSVVDAGVNWNIEKRTLPDASNLPDGSNFLDRSISAGTRNAIEEPAMTAAQFEEAMNAGREIGENLQSDVVCFGEMGIGNTSAASLVAAKILSLPVADLAGRGTGHDDKGLAQKITLLEAASARTHKHLDVRQALLQYGGFEMVMMASAMASGATVGKVILVDGFIATVSALCAIKISKPCGENFIYAHRSAESGHQRVLDAIGVRPLLDLDMRLGEGSGALLAYPLVRAAVAMLNEMASFDQAGVSGPA